MLRQQGMQNAMKGQGVEVEVANLNFRLDSNNGVLLSDKHPICFSDQMPTTMLDLNLSPSWMSPTSTGLMPLVSQYPSHNAPHFEWENVLFHSPVQDLHAPTLDQTMMTPISLLRYIPGSIEGFDEQQISKPTGDRSSLVQHGLYAPSVITNSDLCCSMMDVAWSSRSPHEPPSDQAIRIVNVIDTKEFADTIIQEISNSLGEK